MSVAIGPAHTHQGLQTRGYTQAMPVHLVRTFDEMCEVARHATPRTDEVMITRDGRRLDTPQKVIAWVDEINAERAAEQAAAEDGAAG